MASPLQPISSATAATASSSTSLVPVASAANAAAKVSTKNFEIDKRFGVVVIKATEDAHVSYAAFDVLKYAYANIEAFHTTAAASGALPEAYHIVPLTKQETEAWIDFHESNFLQNYANDIDTEVDKVNTATKLMRKENNRVLLGVMEKVKQVMQRYPNGARVRTTDAGPKGMTLEDKDANDKRTVAVWLKYSAFLGTRPGTEESYVEELFLHNSNIGEMSDSLKRTQHAFINLLDYLKSSPERRNEIMRYYSALSLKTHQYFYSKSMCTIENKVTIATTKYGFLMSEYRPTGSDFDAANKENFEAQRSLELVKLEEFEKRFEEHLKEYKNMQILSAQGKASSMLKFALCITALEQALTKATKEHQTETLNQLEEVKDYLERFIVFMTKLREIEIAHRDQYVQDFYKLLDQLPVAPKHFDNIVGEILKILQFSRENLYKYNLDFQWFADNPEMVAVLGAIDRELEMGEREFYRVRSEEQVMDMLLADTRVYLNAKSYVGKLPFALCFTAFDNRIEGGSEFRCATGNDKDCVGVSSYTGERTRAFAGLLRQEHPFVSGVADSYVDFNFARMDHLNDATKPYRRDYIIDDMHLANIPLTYLQQNTSLIRDCILIVRDYYIERREFLHARPPYVDMAMSMDVFTRKSVYTRLIELSPGVHEEDERQITDSNCLTMEMINNQKIKNAAADAQKSKSKAVTLTEAGFKADKKSKLLMAVNEWTLGAAYAASLERRGKLNEFNLKELKELLATGYSSTKRDE